MSDVDLPHYLCIFKVQEDGPYDPVYTQTWKLPAALPFSLPRCLEFLKNELPTAPESAEEAKEREARASKPKPQKEKKRRRCDFSMAEWFDKQGKRDPEVLPQKAGPNAKLVPLIYPSELESGADDLTKLFGNPVPLGPGHVHIARLGSFE
jgi:hypothetical protein